VDSEISPEELTELMPSVFPLTEQSSFAPYLLLTSDGSINHTPEQQPSNIYNPCISHSRSNGYVSHMPKNHSCDFESHTSEQNKNGYVVSCSQQNGCIPSPTQQNGYVRSPTQQNGYVPTLQSH
jgi:hypothetical protein